MTQHRKCVKIPKGFICIEKFNFRVFYNPSSFLSLKGCFLISNKELQVNEHIHEKQVRVIDEEGNQMGLMSSLAALRVAASKNLDLVNIAPLANPPVCKIMNYGKFKFEQSKKLKESKKSQKTMTIKEIRLSPSINEHDLNTKIKNAIKFLTAGNKVKISVRFKGREMLRANYSHNLIKKIQQACSEHGSLEKPGKLEGKSLTAILIPKQKKQTSCSSSPLSND